MSKKVQAVTSGCSVHDAQQIRGLRYYMICLNKHLFVAEAFGCVYSVSPRELTAPAQLDCEPPAFGFIRGGLRIYIPIYVPC